MLASPSSSMSILYRTPGISARYAKKNALSPSQAKERRMTGGRTAFLFQTQNEAPAEQQRCHAGGAFAVLSGAAVWRALPSGRIRAAHFAAAASAAGSAAGAVAPAGALSRFSVANHAADQETDDQQDDRDEHDIDEIGG